MLLMPRVRNPVLYEIAAHLSPAHLGIDHDRLRFAVLPDLELGRDDPDGSLHLLPLERGLDIQAG